jgi:hypothetical protein
MKKYVAELIGTMILVLMGCGSAVFAGSVAGTVGAGVGTLGVALAFGLAVVAMAYTIGNISGCHINPAITLDIDLNDPLAVRDRAMLEVMYGAGLRLSELVNLDIKHLDLESGEVWVMGKGSKERRLPIGRNAYPLLEYLLLTYFLRNESQIATRSREHRLEVEFYGIT